MTQSVAGVRYRKAMMLVTLSSILVPAAGVLTSPMLARALGVAGRGELAVVLAPATLALAVATLGLPDALTYYVAKHPQITRRAIALALAMSAAMGLLSLAVTAVALPFLTEGNEGLGRLTLLATALLSPAFAIGVLRGAAVGHQMFMTVAVERTVLALLRVVLFGLLLWFGHLTVFTAVLVSQLCPIAAGLVYVRIFGVARNIERQPRSPATSAGPSRPSVSASGWER